MTKYFDTILIVNGKMCLQNNGGGGSYPCPFAYPRSCGKWCVHFGAVKKEKPLYVPGLGTFIGNATYPYFLKLSCGCGVTIRAKKYDEVHYSV